MENYVVVAVFTNEVEAELAHATLAAAGITAYLKFEDMGGMLPPLQESEGIRLVVDAAHADEARSILSQEATTEE